MAGMKPTCASPAWADGLNSVLANSQEMASFSCRARGLRKTPSAWTKPESAPPEVSGQGSIASRMWQFVDRACYCPIVYNSLEAFKEELRFQR